MNNDHSSNSPLIPNPNLKSLNSPTTTSKYVPIIAVAQASFIAFTGFVALAIPETFLKLYGLSPIAATAPAQIMTPAFGARNFGFALSIIAHYRMGYYRGMAVSMLCLSIAGAMDTVVTGMQKQWGGAAFHAGGSALLVFLSSKLW